MIMQLFRLIISFIKESNYDDLLDSLYIHENTPKVFGTKIRRR